MISIKQLHKRFGRQEVLKGIDLHFSAGEGLALIGPNGSGKTTLIKCLLGLNTIRQDQIQFNGQDIFGQSAYRKSIGYMPQISRFPEQMRVKELFMLMKSIRTEVSNYDTDLFEAFEIEALYPKKMGLLSGGMRQKVSAALAFLFHPDVLILDEPTAGLDPVSNEMLKEKLRKTIHQENKLVLITSHVLNDLDDIASRLVYLMEGRVLFDKQLTDLQAETSENRLNAMIATFLRKQTSHG
ncbi:ABC transporter ATP-binding protein [Cyclobacterium roseum]|uniref:ABC transporter ATP-binding protein n=1 Tax=Cyclobacterium roseum TaxID=2666137 RepID=UPI001390CF54|nr:ABC transporter ATP-binding protein [Cyclobacterium roseum]